MKLTDEFDKPAKGISFGQMCALAFTLAALVLVIVLFLNRDRLNSHNPNSNHPDSVDQSQDELSQLEDGENGDTDPQGEKPNADEIWQEIAGDPMTGTEEELEDADRTEDQPDNLPEDQSGLDGEASESGSEPQTVDDENAGEDSTHTIIEYADGSTERVIISPYLPKNTLQEELFVAEGSFLTYQEDGVELSYQGMIVSEDQGIIDYNKARKAGIDFCMVTLGHRGYQTGTITEDSYYFTHMKQATDAGLDVGALFYSQAVTKEEAEEEATFVLEHLEGYSVTYPVVFCMRPVEDEARTDVLSRTGRTAIAEAFLSKIAEAGYVPMLYGNKEWLILRYNLASLSQYDIWLEQYKDVPQYPYELAMWSYDTEGTVNGVSGKIELMMSLEDFSIK